MQSYHPQFTVIIPTFNRGNMIVSTLESVVTQTFLPHEIILCDDGSTDDTAAQADKYLRSKNIEYRIIVIENSGPSYARKIAAQQASGNWICFLDSDDTWDEHYLSTLSAIIEKQQPEAIISNFRMIKNDEVNTASKFLEAPQGFWGDDFDFADDTYNYKNDDLFLKTFDFQPAFTSAQAFSTAAYEKVGGITLSSRTLKSEDAHFVRKLYFYCRVCFNNNTAINIFIHDDNRSNDGNGQVDLSAKKHGRLHILKLLAQEDVKIGHPFHESLLTEIEKSQVDYFNTLFWSQHYSKACDEFKKISLRYFNLKIIIRFFIARLKY
jgi:glycosyltransferase involved in cell wall biosynthesis